MWPKAVAQLIELAPHVTRLVPLADRFFQGKSTAEENSRRALETMEELRSDLGRVTASHEGLYRQINGHGEKLSAISADVGLLSSTAATLEGRLARTERQVSLLVKLLVFTLVLGLASVVLLVVMLLRHA